MGNDKAIDSGTRQDAQRDWLADVARSAHVAVVVTRLDDGRYVAANDAACRLFKLRRDQMVGHSALGLGLWPDPAQRERLLAQVQQHGSVSGYEVRYRNALGEIGDMAISAQVVHRDGAAFLVGVLTDVTDRRELLEGLRQTQDRLAVVLRASGMLVFRQDRDLRYTWVANPVLGAAEDGILGRTDDELLGPEVAAPLVAIKRRVLDSGRAERRDVWVENNGQSGCFDLVVEPERDALGQVVGIVCAAQDITARMGPPPPAATADDDTDPGLPDAAAHQLLATLARTARRPLRTVAGLSRLVAGEPLGERQHQRLRRIAAESRRQADLVDAALALADGQPVPPPQLRALAALVQRAARADTDDGAAADADTNADGPPDDTAPDGHTALAWLRARHAGAAVVVVEDNPVMRELMRSLLEHAGLQPLVASNGIQAFDLATRPAVRLVLLDMELPQRGAVAAAMAIRRALPRWVPIVAVMSERPLTDPQRLLDADLDDLLVKPMGAEALYDKVLAWLEAG